MRKKKRMNEFNDKPLADALLDKCGSLVLHCSLYKEFGSLLCVSDNPQPLLTFCFQKDEDFLPMNQSKGLSHLEFVWAVLEGRIDPNRFWNQGRFW